MYGKFASYWDFEHFINSWRSYLKDSVSIDLSKDYSVLS